MQRPQPVGQQHARTDVHHHDAPPHRVESPLHPFGDDRGRVQVLQRATHARPNASVPASEMKPRVRTSGWRRKTSLHCLVSEQMPYSKLPHSVPPALSDPATCSGVDDRR